MGRLLPLIDSKNCLEPMRYRDSTEMLMRPLFGLLRRIQFFPLRTLARILPVFKLCRENMRELRGILLHLKTEREPLIRKLKDCAASMENTLIKSMPRMIRLTEAGMS